MLRRIFSAKVVAAEAILLLGVMLASLGMLVSPVAACIAAGTLCILAGVGFQLYTGSDFVNRNLGWLVVASSVMAAVAAMAGGIVSGKIVCGVISAVAALLIVLAIMILKKLWAHLVLAVVAIVAMVMMVMPSYAAEPVVAEEESDEDETDAEASEIEALRADLEEALQTNENLRRLYEEQLARCKDCPICNGTMTLEELQEEKNTNVKKTSNGIAYVGKALGDGQGNGAGLAPVTPVYDPNVPAPGSNEPVKVIASEKDVDFTGDSDDKDVDVDDRHEETPSAGDDSDNKPVVEEDKTEKTQELTYSVAGNTITVKAANGFTAVSDILSYIVAKGDVTVVSASAQENILTITFEASEDAKLVICKGMFKSGDVKSAELVVSVQKTSKVEEEKPSQDDDSNKTEEEKPVDQPKEMQVQSIDIQTICDKAYEGDSLQFVVVANGQNVDYSKIAVSMGSIAADGTWTIVAPAESGSATVSFGNISKTVGFEVVVDASSDDEVPPTDDDPSDNDPTEEPEQPEEDDPKEEEPSEPVENGTLTSISLYDSSVVCGSDIQGEVAFEGNVNWDEVEVSGLNGLGCEISDGMITIHTSEVASSYEIIVSYNGSSVSASFDVEGVEDADIDWN